MRILRFKGDPTRNAVTVIAAGAIGAATGVAVEHMSWPRALGVAVVVGLAAGGLLYALLSVWMRRKSK
jgi:hypothetical protein